MLISFSDSVSLDLSGTEAEAEAAEGLWGDFECRRLGNSLPSDVT